MCFRFIILEIYSKCDVIVEMYDPRISYSNIGTDGVSACHFYLLVGTYNNKNFCYLDHDMRHYENVSPSNFISLILDSFVTELSKDLMNSSDDTIKSLKNLHLMVGGGQKEENDIVRNGFSLLVNPDARTATKLKSFFGNTRIKQLFEKLINNITILKAVSYKMPDRKEIKAASKHLLLIKI